MVTLLRDKYGNSIQAFPLVEGQISVGPTDGPTSNGIFTKIDSVCCIEDGDITITFNSTGTKTISLVVGEVYTIQNVSKVTIISGLFHLA